MKPTAIDPLQLAVDELGDVAQRLAPHRADFAREKTLEKQIREHFDAKPADSAFIAAGTKYALDVGPRGFKTIIKYKALIKLIGAKAWFGFSSCTLESLKANVDERIVENVTSKEQIGPRTLGSVYEQL
ncbi:MAG: hypothetical protein NVSMB64_14040 [Candidatus Velthaea sp.]